ncbi:MAG: ABC transporter permease [Burkholderiales bacterium]|uniref:ABC transporter permease n=1 Tax=Nitrosomonas sp. TaxID=42353 RepID=UPI001D2AC0B9|nr:ABC transporter permease [Nitrosomonas sp.]MCB1950107.1 ABC transporter permease [Nitrosomonas sp.]MCP5242729.1 ABC transporter permease [Burkholderiales bacterium]MDR4515143.1 ABC transporter permease [Nitrosomonas sp.]
MTNKQNPNTDWYQLVNDGDSSRIILTGDFTLAVLNDRFKNLSAELAEQAKNPNLRWDMSGIQHIDNAGIIMLWKAWNAQRPAQLILRDEHDKMLKRIELMPVETVESEQKDFLWPVYAAGKQAMLLWDNLTGVIRMIGQLLLDCMFFLRNPGYIPWREISANLFRTGAQALGITALVGFLIGIVLSYLSSEQLQMFGADIFIVNILGISIIRELGPLLAAILVAGRSGSSMTAQLGVMRVTQELDALTVMGISQSQRLIFPKIIGLGLAMPLLVLWTSAIALLGGIIAAEIQLGLNYYYFIYSLPDAVPIANLWLGLGKGVVCGMVIAVIACHFGLRVKPNTESLGEGTTTSVVTSITVVIIIDAIFAVVFSDVGII